MVAVSETTLETAFSPVERIATDPHTDEPVEGTGLCLSGGGYRAMLFHVGSLWRLNELGMLPRLDRISSVSGGSITATALGQAWERLDFDSNGVARRFEQEVVQPVRKLAGRTIDIGSILRGVFGPGSVSEKLVAAYRKHLFGDRTLQDLPDRPRFVINAANVQSKALWRFSKPYMRDWRVGEVRRPQVSLATAVAASSAFPPFLSPLVLKLDENAFSPASGYDLQQPPYTTQVVLSDGGVYDNLGLETVWKKFKRVLVSDGGGRVPPEPAPKRDWAQHTCRVIDLLEDQVRALRKRQLIGAFARQQRQGCYWSVWTNIEDYKVKDPLDCPRRQTIELASVATRLKALPQRLQERLINWGYAACDAAMRAYGGAANDPPARFPYPGGVF